MKKSNVLLRVLSDYRFFGNGDARSKKCPTMQDLIIPHMLAVSQCYHKEIFIEYSLDVCMGSDLSAKTISLHFTTKARAEVCRDDILEAIDKYWTLHV